MATITPGPHPITLKITYSDDLKVQHQLLVNSSVDFKTKQSQSARAGNSDGGYLALIAGIINNIMFFVIIVAVIILVIFLIKKRKSKSKKTKFTSSSEMESFLDDVSSTNANTSEDL